LAMPERKPREHSTVRIDWSKVMPFMMGKLCDQKIGQCRLPDV